MARSSLAQPQAPQDEGAASRAPATPPASARPSARAAAQRPVPWLLEGSGWTFLRLAVDATLLLAAVVSATAGAEAAGLDYHDGDLALTWLFAPLALVLLAARGAYERKLQILVLDKIPVIVGATSLAAILILAAATFMNPTIDPDVLLVRAWVFGTLYVVGGRILLALTQRQARANRIVGKPALIVGAGTVGAQVERRLELQPELGLTPIGYLDADPPPDVPQHRRAPILGHPADLARVADETGAAHVIFAFLSAPDSVLLPLVRECEVRGLEMSLVPRLFDSVNVRVELDHIGGLPLYGLSAVNPKGWEFKVKHATGIAIAALLVLVLAPVLLAAAVAVKLSSPGPILFSQRRIGRDGREFLMLKFRSMRVDAARGVPAAISEAKDTAPGGVEGEDRRTPVGAFLRRTSIDELPQLINVLKGDMSVVGPRPERPEFVELFGQSVRRYDERHRVKSGITGWAQVHGFRGKTSLADRVEWDNFYIENWSLGLDLKILVMTIGTLFIHRSE